MRRMVLLIITIALSAGTAAYAHHSYAATYDTTEQVKLEGKVVQFVFRNPHSFVHIQAPDQKGVSQRWAVEWAATAQLKESGVDYDALKPGDHVIVTGNPGRNPADHRLRMQSVERPKDGWKWSGTVR